ncbi:MAG TPA: glutamate--tRNA ligase family protein, partial [Oscillospiraceae bacterium]|nr:glutamate--tRNA ligase family protein [Oscillospiraceae bacterium]
MVPNRKWFDEMESRIPKGEVRTRFAPSPTGYMHVGNLRTALYTWLIARRNGGKFLLRIEDTDQVRFVEGATDAIYKTLEKCGLTHDEGPDIGGPVGPYVQTERRGLYKKYAELLVETGGAYRCFCTKERLEALHAAGGGVGGYDGHCANLTQEEIAQKLAAGEPYVIRQRIPKTG